MTLMTDRPSGNYDTHDRHIKGQFHEERDKVKK